MLWPDKKTLIIAFFSVLLMSSCDQSVVFEKNQPIPSEGWHYRDIVSFEAEVNDTTSLHNLYINVRNTTDYGYSNFYLFLNIEFPDGTTLRDTIECILAQRNGQWSGKGFGKIRSNSFLFRTNVWFPQPGNYVFRMEQAMRTELLEGIADIGLRIERK
jgi:gliding motility-associated lipoprotein GldH